MSSKKVLVTGASGLLGKDLCERFASVYEVSGTRRTSGADLSDPVSARKLLHETQPDLIVHSAAYSDVDGCELDPKRAFDSNALAVKNLSALCAEAGIPWIHVSTDYVFDGRGKKPYLETDPTAPVNIYGLSKLAGEYFAMNGSAGCAVVRTSWLFGPGVENNFVNAVLTRLKTEKTVSVLDDQTDAPTSIKDLGEAIGRIAEEMLTGKWKDRREIYQVCNTGEATRLEMAQWMRECLGKGARVERTDRSKIPNRVALRPHYVVMSNEKFSRAFGMKLRPWRESLKEYVLSKDALCAS